MAALLVAMSLACGAKHAPPSYLLRMVNLLQACRADVPAMRPVAEEAADRLAKGGKLWASGNAGLISEMNGRAGGFMMLRSLAHGEAGPGDVVLHFPQDGLADPVGAVAGGALVVTFSAEPAAPPARWFNTHAREAGISPTLGMAVPAWLFTGELVSALTRLGRMPVMYESIGAYGGYARIAKYKDFAWHADLHVQPCPPGVLADLYVDTVCAILRRIAKDERAKLDRAGAWARDARAKGRRLTMYSMGHIFPAEISGSEIAKVFHSEAWNAGFRGAKPDHGAAPGDVIVHIGYQHPPEALLRTATSVGARVVYVSVRPDRDFTRSLKAIWIDPMWDWPDSCVTLEGYDIPLLPASGVVNGAIAWEIYRLTVEGK